ncbi:response regulator transcription factor [Petroclostridium sp. X23]|uniref:response regulator transcription factor n=1 Tax=Petroclostridium sp. X23 TaxID=3045146 RepID=UPI0024ADD9D7|nr:response regulator transcription factor [Petroclostridium sp. X23]WHH61766.1 response regulator transcription factor [Petroclostridium sp. X23]
MALKILIVDDEKLLVKGIKFNFEQDGYQVETAYDGEEAIKIARHKTVDLIILDLMLPQIDGLTVCQKVREFSNVPIIMLTAKNEDIDKILGLEYGADDYLTKPFNILELKARVKAILRRVTAVGHENRKTNLKIGDIQLDYNTRKVNIKGKEIELTAKEFDLIDLFASNPGRVYSRENLLDIIWGYDYPGDIRTVDVHVRRLREKIEPNPAHPEYILTKWGVGYYFKEI